MWRLFKNSYLKTVVIVTFPYFLSHNFCTGLFHFPQLNGRGHFGHVVFQIFGMEKAIAKVTFSKNSQKLYLITIWLLYRKPIFSLFTKETVFFTLNDIRDDANLSFPKIWKDIRPKCLLPNSINSDSSHLFRALVSVFCANKSALD